MYLATAITIAQDPTNANISAIAVKNPLAPTTLLLEAAAPDQLIDEDNVNNYNSINWKQLPDL